MIADPRHQTWFLDQLTKSEFFHQKLHGWKMLSVAEAIESFRGDTPEGTLLTDRARADLELNRHTITHWFTVESILTDGMTWAEVFELLSI
ncbi:MAG: hypothetical protein H5T61_04050 [Thermoflexales bacterium]|nr:hypothetical protein [Thermoflexales bacterium]